MMKKEWYWMSKFKGAAEDHCNYSGLPSPKAYEKKQNKVMKKENLFIWGPIVIAFICMMYSIGLGLSGSTAEAQYSAHWPGTILLFTIAINQIILNKRK